MHDVTKLPKWAQEYIERLKAEVENARELLKEVETEEETPISWEYGLDISVGIPRYANILFRLEDGGYISAKWRGQSVDIRSVPDRLHIDPIGGNAISIHMRR